MGPLLRAGTREGSTPLSLLKARPTKQMLFLKAGTVLGAPERVWVLSDPGSPSGGDEACARGTSTCWVMPDACGAGVAGSQQDWLGQHVSHSDERLGCPLAAAASRLFSSWRPGRGSGAVVWGAAWRLASQGEDGAAACGRDGPRDHHEGHPQREGPVQGATRLGGRGPPGHSDVPGASPATTAGSSVSV